MSEELYLSFNNYLKNLYGCKVYRIPLNTGLSCPNRENGNSGCIFCDEFGSGASYYPDYIKTIKDQIEFSMNMFSEKRKAELFYLYFQSFTNTYGELEELKNLYDNVFYSEKIKGMIIGTRPDCINDDKLKLISLYAGKYDVWIELGLQSSSDGTLKKINRGHTADDFIKAVQLCKKYNIKVTAHIIIGLPFETKTQMFETGKFVSDLKVEGIKIHSLYIIKNTKLAEIYQTENFKLLTMEEYSDIVSDILLILPENTVIHRLSGETDKEKIIAPDWVNNKTLVLNTIKQKLLLKKNGI